MRVVKYSIPASGGEQDVPAGPSGEAAHELQSCILLCGDVTQAFRTG